MTQIPFTTRLAAIAFIWGLHASSVDAVDFARDVRPILSKHCFKCHGPDDKTREAKLRLDTRDGALAETASGSRAVVAGRVADSELVHRIFSSDEDQVMPPPSAKNPLTDGQRQILKQWIVEGAEYKPHWAFIAPVRPQVPSRARFATAGLHGNSVSEFRNPIDTFVQQRLQKENLSPSAPADRFTLVRRTSLDLTGLPPTPDEADDFANDPAPDAYERLVDRLLASPHYGERWTRRWLDLARYADTNGYEKDRQRSIWPYRDWVLNALNADLPFDQFTVEQLAGDMLPNATLDQRVATGFHRNTMLNEEGGIDPLEFRFHAMTDRVATTGTVWLGLTIGCAQCHTHKFDPIPHREYYQFFGLLNNAEEPEIEVLTPDRLAQRQKIETQAAALEADLANRFPPEGNLRWLTPVPSAVSVASRAVATLQADKSVLLSGENPPTDTYTLTFDSDATDVTSLRVEAIPDPSLGKQGPGRTPHGNFVLTEISVTAAPISAPDQAQPVKLVRAESDFSQNGFPAIDAIDGKPKSGWAIHGNEPWNVLRTATFHFEKPLTTTTPIRWTVKLDQQHGMQHTLGRFRVGLGQALSDGRPVEIQRRDHLERKFTDWLKLESQRAIHWTVLRPISATSNLPLLTVEDDLSIFASGDQSKADTYELAFQGDFRGVTAIRIEALPDERLPKRGPGRVYYEGPHGDFWMSDFKLLTARGNGKPALHKIARASQSFANGGNSATAALDDNKQTGWSINGGQGREHEAVFNLAEPLGETDTLQLQLLFEKYYAAGLGRFRISVTTNATNVEARNMPDEIDRLLLVPEIARTAEQRQRLLQHFVTVAPELASERKQIDDLRRSLPAVPTTLAFTERPATNPRPTFRHHRGEFLQPQEKVEPALLSFLPGIPPDAPRNRLSFAQWLVAPQNPLMSRVTVNRHWATFFGRGLVRTTEDFGYQGELPSHPDLLDWLATTFAEPTVANPFSTKRLHRLIVTSGTYRQTSQLTPELLARDPQNELLARGPRVRLEAELVRDSMLRISGLLSTKLGGPSVFPPQPSNVTTEGAYGQLAWNVSSGGDRYRRGLYTYAKRTAPYAMFLTFDGPSGEACVARREVSNTPLQALTLLNDGVFLDTAQALARTVMATHPETPPAVRAATLFRRCLTRPPTNEELATLVRFYETQQQRFVAKELDATAIAGPAATDQPIDDIATRAAWTTVARALLNVDETIVKD